VISLATDEISVQYKNEESALIILTSFFSSSERSRLPGSLEETKDIKFKYIQGMLIVLY
jgi:hypothetical protein